MSEAWPLSACLEGGMLGKRPRCPLPLDELPNEVLLKIIRFLCAAPNSRSPPSVVSAYMAANAFEFALCSHKLFRLFKEGCISCVDAVPDKNFLEPLARSDSRFRVRDPKHLKTVVKLAGECLVELHLPVYDCSMEDAQWSILGFVAEHCTNLQILSFVDSFHHSCTTPPHAQRAIFAKLLQMVRHLSVYVVREASKLDTMTRTAAFQPYSLVLHNVHPKLHRNVIHMLCKRGRRLTSLTISFEQIQPEYKRQLGDYVLPFLCSLSNTVAQQLTNLESLFIVTGPRQNPLTALPGPSVSSEKSQLEFQSVSTALQEAKAKLRPERHTLKRLVFERICPKLVSVIKLFAPHCDPLTSIEACLHEVLLVSPPNVKVDSEASLPFFRATKLHSSSWMIKELPRSYFRAIEHIHVGVDEDCSKSSRPWYMYDRIFPSGGARVNPDMQSFRFLCESAGGCVKSVFARVPIESSDNANVVLRILSSGFAYARNVATLELSGDVLKHIGVDYALLYSIVGQLKSLEELFVSDPTRSEYQQAQIENLPVLLRGLWTCCRKLRSFQMELTSFGNASVEQLQYALDALKEFDQKLPGVETHNLGELLAVSLAHCSDGAQLAASSILS